VGDPLDRPELTYDGHLLHLAIVCVVDSRNSRLSARNNGDAEPADLFFAPASEPASSNQQKSINMYLMTAHRTFIGIEETGKLVQLQPSIENIHKFLKCEDYENGGTIEAGPLASYMVERTPQGIAFVRNEKYLCAPSDAVTVVTDRDRRNQWETFAMIPDDMVLKCINTGNNGEVARFRQEVLKLQSNGEPVKVYCGAGTVPRSGFLNLDIQLEAPSFFVSNFAQYFIFPFADTDWGLPDNCVDYIFHEDFIEHITQLAQWQFLAETLRVLRPGCWHRVNTPNILASMKRHSDFKKGFPGVYTGEEQWGHIAMLSPLVLKEMAEVVGYSEVVFTTRHHGVSPYAEADHRPGSDRDPIKGNIYADLQK
jgi:predicted SAM-dependent methyltransferase